MRRWPLGDGLFDIAHLYHRSSEGKSTPTFNVTTAPPLLAEWRNGQRAEGYFNSRLTDRYWRGEGPRVRGRHLIGSHDNQRRPSSTRGSNLGLFRHLQRVVHLDAKVNQMCSCTFGLLD